MMCCPNGRTLVACVVCVTTCSLGLAAGLDGLCPLFASQPAVWALQQGMVTSIACSFITCRVGHAARHGHVHCLLCNLPWALQPGAVACIVRGVLLVLLTLGFQVQSCSRNVVASPCSSPSASLRGFIVSPCCLPSMLLGSGVKGAILLLSHPLAWASSCAPPHLPSSCPQMGRNQGFSCFLTDDLK
eukprot:1101858-Rhodomonas_salina.2